MKIWKTGGLRKAQENTSFLKKPPKLDDFRMFGQTVRGLKDACSQKSCVFTHLQIFIYPDETKGKRDLKRVLEKLPLQG